jgi:SAM-dependent methyltransferase
MYEKWKTQDLWVEEYVIPRLNNHFLEKNFKLLDIGCGQGILYEKLPPHIKKNYIGSDFSQPMLDLFLKNHTEVKMINDNIVNTRLINNFCDISVCLNVLMYFEKDIVVTISNINKITNNFIILSVPLAEQHSVNDQSVIFGRSYFLNIISDIIKYKQIEVVRLNCNNYFLLEITK